MSDAASRVLAGLDRVMSEWRLRTVAAVLLLLVFILRFPFFFPAVLSWDESTYILLGQDVLNGNLPYDRFWDVKPPLAYVAYAVAIALFGHTVEGIRLAGTLCVAVAATAIYLAARRRLGDGRAVVAAVLVVFSVVQQQAGRATMTEHFAIAPLCAAFALLVAGADDRRTFAWVGLLLAIATLIRTNLAYVSLLVAASLFLRPGAGRPVDRLRDLVSLGLPAVGVILICVIPYALAGKLSLLRAAMIDAPLAYSQVQHGIADSIFRLSLGIGVRSNPPLALYLWLGGLLGAFWLSTSAFRRHRSDRLSYWLLVFILSATYSVLVSGGGHGHYLIQLAPFYALAAVYWFVDVGGGRLRLLGFVLASVGVALAMVPVMGEYAALAERLAKGEGARTGRALEVAEYVAREAPPDGPVYLMQDHLAYWLLGSEPLTRMTAHPSNFSKPFLLKAAVGPEATPTGELRRVFDLKPVLVIKPERVRYLENDQDAHTFLNDTLTTDFVRVATIGGLAVYRRKSS